MSKPAGAGGDYSLVFFFFFFVGSCKASLGTTGSGSVSGKLVFAGNTMTVNLTDLSDVQADHGDAERRDGQFDLSSRQTRP